MDLSQREGRREQGALIKQAAKEAGLTLDELARKIGCSRALIFQYASGSSLAQSDRLQQIAEVVGKPLPWFFSPTDSNLPEDANATQFPALEAEALKLSKLKEELEAERLTFEQRREAETIASLEALLKAYESPTDYKKVVECCQQLQPLLSRGGGSERLAALLLRQGNALLQLQDWGVAKEKLEQAGSLYRQSGEMTLARDCTQSLGHANLMLGRAEEALKQFEFVASGEDWTNRWQGALSSGATYETLGKYEFALASFETALKIVDEKGEAPETEIPRLYIEANWSNLELDFGDFAGALERSRRCARTAQRKGVQDQYLEALLTSGVCLLNRDEISEAIACLQQAFDLSQLASDQQRTSLALSCLALCGVVANRCEEAISQGKEALSLALRCSAVRAEVLAQRALGEAYLRSSNIFESTYHIEQGLTAAINLRLHLPQSQFWNLKARAQLATGHADLALVSGEKALNLAAELQARPAQFESLLTLARASVECGEAKSALVYAKESIGLAFSLKSPSLFWRAKSVLALAVMNLSERSESKLLFQEAVSDFEIYRAQLRENLGEDVAIEDPLGLELWQNWLSLVKEIEGFEEAQKQAGAANWPPLIDWLETQQTEKGGMPDA